MKLIKGIVVPIALAIIIGYISGRYVFRTYKNNLYNVLSSSRLYLIESGEYESIDTMREDDSSNRYVYYLDNDKYKKVVGITRDYDNIGKIKSLYNDTLTVAEYYIPSNLVSNEQVKYDEMLKKTSNHDELKEVVNNILALYQTGDGIKLISG